MPVYEYHCETHGSFEAMRPMADYAAPCPCPVCGAMAERVLLSVPRLAVMETGKRRAHETNERSAHEPKRSGTHGLTAGKGAGARVKNTGVRAPDGSTAFPAKRPWMLSQ
ncbi:MAG: zinc ribbon domain-containing protein [Pseudomonadota bacterium]